MDEAARKPASKPSPCPRVSARSVLTGRRARTGRAAEDVGPYHRSAPTRDVLTGRRPRTGRAAEDVGPYHRSAPTRDVPVRRMARRAMSPRRAVGRRGDVVRVKPSWRTRWRMKPRARQPQNQSPCPRASARSVLTGRRARTGRAAEDVGPYHRSAPTRGVRTVPPTSAPTLVGARGPACGLRRVPARPSRGGRRGTTRSRGPPPGARSCRPPSVGAGSARRGRWRARARPSRRGRA